MIIIRNSVIPFKGFKAITLWPFIFVRNNASFTEADERHERIHGRQQVEMLLLPFLLWYGLEWLIRLIITGSTHRAYRDIGFEQEAYTNQNDEEYLNKRRLYAWFKYLW